MRTIDEVIESCERVAQSAREKARSIKPDETNIPMINDIFELADEQEQLARWLKELKRLIEEKKREEGYFRISASELRKICPYHCNPYKEDSHAELFDGCKNPAFIKDGESFTECRFMCNREVEK